MESIIIFNVWAVRIQEFPSSMYLVGFLRAPPYWRGFPGDEVLKNLSASAGEARDIRLIPGSGRFSGVENSNTLRCFCLENSMDRGAWQAVVLVVTKSRTRLRVRAHTHTHTHARTHTRTHTHARTHTHTHYYLAGCVSWIPKLTLLDFWTNRTYECTLRMEHVCQGLTESIFLPSTMMFWLL